MNNLQKLLKTLPLLGFFVAAILFFNACSPKIGTLSVIKIKKFINWQVEFNENTSDADKAKALTAIDKYILDDLNKQGFLIANIRFLHIPNKNNTRIQVDVTGNSSTNVFSTIKPHGPGPKKEFFSPTIKNFRPVMAHNELGTFTENGEYR